MRPRFSWQWRGNCACSGSVGASQFVEAEHQDPPDSPPHVHLDDGSTVIQGLGVDADLMGKLLNDEAVIVGEPNDSVQNVVFTIPTMF